MIDANVIASAIKQHEDKFHSGQPSAASGVMADTFTVHLTRREIMHLPIETRRRILAEQVDTFLTHCEGCQEEIPDSELDQANYTADDVFLCGECCEGMYADPLARMVDRFLGWKLPEDFLPDAGISFDRSYVDKWGMPIGTNLFTANQTREMIEYLLEIPKEA